VLFDLSGPTDVRSGLVANIHCTRLDWAAESEGNSVAAEVQTLYKTARETLTQRAQELNAEPLSIQQVLDKCNKPSSRKLLRQLVQEDAGEDIAEYAVILAVILVVVVGTVRLIGSNANNVFSSVASSVQ
jgi:Flp pilus assembly pilin Flp